MMSCAGGGGGGFNHVQKIYVVIKKVENGTHGDSSFTNLSALYDRETYPPSPPPLSVNGKIWTHDDDIRIRV